MRPLIPSVLAAVLLAPVARAALVEAPAAWGAYAQSLAAPGNAVAGALSLNFGSPLVAGSFASVMSLQPSLTPAALAAMPAPQQTAAIQGAIRAAAAPMLQPAAPGVPLAAALQPEALVHLDALAGALPEDERGKVVAGVKAELERRGDSLADEVRRVSASFETRQAEDLSATAEAAARGVRPSGLKPFVPSSRTRSFMRADVESPVAAEAPRALTFRGYGEARDWLKAAPMGFLDKVNLLPTHSNEAGAILSRSAMLAKLARAQAAWPAGASPLPVMISHRPSTRRILGFDVPVETYDVLISEVADDAPVARAGTTGLHLTGLQDALDVIRGGVFLAAPGRVTFYGSRGNEDDVRKAAGQPALRLALGDGFRRTKYFGDDAYAPAFAAEASAVGREAPVSVSPGAHNSVMAEYARAGFLRRVPFTAADAAATLILLEQQRSKGLSDAVYLPMKAALEQVLPPPAPVPRREARPEPPPAAAVPLPAPDPEHPFRSIVPKASRERLAAELAADKDAPLGTTKRALLGNGTEAYNGVYAVAEKTAAGNVYYVEKLYDAKLFVDGGIKALSLARLLKSEGLLGGLDVVEVLSAAPERNKVRLSFTEGLDMARVSAEQETNPAYAELVKRYKAALDAAAAALNKAGWKTSASSDGALYVYGSGRPEADGSQKLVFQFLAKNVVATPDGRFVLIDPF